MKGGKESVDGSKERLDWGQRGGAKVSKRLADVNRGRAEGCKGWPEGRRG